MAGKTVSQLFDEVDSNSFTVELISPIDEISVLPEVEVTNPYEFDFSRLVPGQVVMDIDRFVEVASQLIEWAQRKEGIDENKFVKLTCEYGEANFEFWKSGQEVITWKIVSREPALMN
jgi:hypothetical protein